MLDKSKPSEFVTRCGKPIADGTVRSVTSYTMYPSTFNRSSQKCKKCA